MRQHIIRAFIIISLILAVGGVCFSQTPTVANFTSSAAVISDSGVQIYPHMAPVVTEVCVVVGAGCSPGTVTIGDVLIAFAYRNGSTTAPTNATGWTSILTGTGANTQNRRVSCMVATTTTPATPTFTNATDTIILKVKYGTSSAVATAGCNTSAVGGTVTTNTNSGATATYGTISAFTNGDKSSYAVMCAGSTSATSQTAPSGTALITGATVGSAPMASCFITTSQVASWTSATGAVSPNSASVEAGIEILGAGVIESRMTRPTKLGNTLICGVSYPVKSTVIKPILSDNGGDTFTNEFAWDDGNNTQSTWVASNIAANSTKVTIAFADPVNSAGFFSQCTQADNISTSSPLDGNPSGGGAATGTTLSTNGSCFHSIVGVCQNGLSTSSDGDYIWTWAINNGNCSAQVPTVDNFTPGGSGVLLSHDPTTKQAVETQIQSTHGTLTPSMTQDM